MSIPLGCEADRASHNRGMARAQAKTRSKSKAKSRETGRPQAQAAPAAARAAPRTLYILSDSTGNLPQHMLTAILTQFPGCAFVCGRGRSFLRPSREYE